LPFPHFNPVLVQIGPLAIRWYALAYVAGILLGWRYAVALVRNARIWRGTTPTATDQQVDDLVLWVALGIVVGGRLGSVLFYNTSVIWTDPLEIVKAWHGGMSFHGGLIGVIIALYFFSRRNKIDLLRLGDLTAPCVPIGLFFGRLANFVNGEWCCSPSFAGPPTAASCCPAAAWSRACSCCSTAWRGSAWRTCASLTATCRISRWA
jgi:phosphatidylglycerol:prolipoprotein diacylglycerol transferase